MAKLVTAYDKRTGESRLVPENWFDHKHMSSGLTRRKPELKTPVTGPKSARSRTAPPTDSTTGENTDTPQPGEK